MSYCQREATGKDKSVFVTKEDASKTEMVKELVEEDIHGVVLPNGDINWDCPCLGSLPHGPCGEEFKAAFSCFHFSEEEEKGVECIPKFRGMQECFQKHPEEYSKYADDDQQGSEEGEALENSESMKSNSGIESRNEPKTESRSESGSKTEPRNEPKTESRSESDSKTESGNEPKTESRSESESKTESRNKPKTESRSESESKPDSVEIDSGSTLNTT